MTVLSHEDKHDWLHVENMEAMLIFVREIEKAVKCLVTAQCTI